MTRFDKVVPVLIVIPTAFVSCIIRHRGRFSSGLLLLFFVLFVLSVPRLDAQTLPAPTASDMTGTQSYQSYHGGDIDSISLSTGTLTVNLPFLSYPQRGKLHLGFNLMYNNQPQHLTCVLNNLSCKWYWQYNLNAGPSGTHSGVLPLENGDVFVGWAQQVAVNATTVTQTYENGLVTDNWLNFYLLTADGAEHPLGVEGSVSSCGTSNYYYFTNTGPWETLDATSWRVLGSWSPGAFGNCPPTATSPTAAIDADGVTHSLLAHGLPDLDVGSTDPNGNQIALASSTITDTLGRQMPLPPNINSTSRTSTSSCPTVGGLAATYAVPWTPPAYNGGSGQYTFCYAVITMNLPPTATSGPVVPFSSTKLQSIVLPNGQSWQFQYQDEDGTYNDGSL
jgi:hypothetical protein